MWHPTPYLLALVVRIQKFYATCFRQVFNKKFQKFLRRISQRHAHRSDSHARLLRCATSFRKKHAGARTRSKHGCTGPAALSVQRNQRPVTQTTRGLNAMLSKTEQASLLRALNVQVEPQPPGSSRRRQYVVLVPCCEKFTPRLPVTSTPNVNRIKSIPRRIRMANIRPETRRKILHATVQFLGRGQRILPGQTRSGKQHRAEQLVASRRQPLQDFDGNRSYRDPFAA